MTTLLDQAITLIRELPDDVQDVLIPLDVAHHSDLISPTIPI